MKTDRDFDIAVAEIQAGNVRLIQEFLRSRRRKRDPALAGLPQKPVRQEPRQVEPGEAEPQEGGGYGS